MIRKDYREIFKLAGMLVARGIPFEFHEIKNGARIAYPDNDNTVCSAIEHDESYGNYNDTIEIMGLLTDEEYRCDIYRGGLDAEDVFFRILNHYKYTFGG